MGSWGRAGVRGVRSRGRGDIGLQVPEPAAPTGDGLASRDTFLYGVMQVGPSCSGGATWLLLCENWRGGEGAVVATALQTLQTPHFQNDEWQQQHGHGEAKDREAAEGKEGQQPLLPCE